MVTVMRWQMAMSESVYSLRGGDVFVGKQLIPLVVSHKSMIMHSQMI
jgi:hypothetical protein